MEGHFPGNEQAHRTHMKNSEETTRCHAGLGWTTRSTPRSPPLPRIMTWQAPTLARPLSVLGSNFTGYGPRGGVKPGELGAESARERVRWLALFGMFHWHPLFFQLTMCSGRVSITLSQCPIGLKRSHRQAPCVRSGRW